MALKDLKSNLAKGVGKPKGSPDGNIKNESPFDKLVSGKLGSIRGKNITSDIQDVPKYKEFTANGEKV